MNTANIGKSSKSSVVVAAPSEPVPADANYYDPGDDDDDASAVVADVEDDPIAPEEDTPRRWGDFEMSSTSAADIVQFCPRSVRVPCPMFDTRAAISPPSPMTSATGHLDESQR
jgi:hypothetical protein